MAFEIKVPVLPESVKDGTLVKWYKNLGDAVKRDENLVDVETDKVVLEVVAPSDGVLSQVLKPQGSTVLSQEIIAYVEAGLAASPVAPELEAKPVVPVSEPKSVAPIQVQTKVPETPTVTAAASPAVRRLAHEHEVSLEAIAGSGKHGRITKTDVLGNLNQNQNSKVIPVLNAQALNSRDRKVPMTRLRAKIAERLVESQNTAAILTTFNEINMQPIMDVRKKYKDNFEKKHQSRLGLMSFFVMAVLEALKRHPIVNASVSGSDIVYHDYYDIGVAVSSPRGLVVPVIRNADTLSFAQIENKIVEFGEKAKNSSLSLDELSGGTFTISNGGVFGSLMSTPIVNPPQSGILGMHKIEERPVVEEGQIVIRPMMYVALSYDHRIIDGSDSVRFLVAIKEMIEDPIRLLLHV
ncbi:MAG: 2-oxoglutarate dehydrogenase complex dihydrolipoyllysine-residue succinyltransferase [Gammaproteobacteria bacterium]